MITKSMIEDGLRDNTIKLIIDPNMRAGTVCQIGDDWFYFGGHTAEELEPDDYRAAVPIDDIVSEIYDVLESFREDSFFEEEYTYYVSVLTENFVRQIEPGIELYRDRVSGIAWAEDHSTGLGISVHPNIDETGSVDGMVNLGYWRKDDRVVKSHGWIYNIDRLAYDSNDPIEAIVASECRCAACLERRKESGMKRLNVTVQCMAVYNSAIDVPEQFSLEQAIAYAKQNISNIPLGVLEYVQDSDLLDEDNCCFDD